ncbi:N-acetyltransferase [Catellatospora methionotrophica]|uniref:N-acetyltransferase n=1 Tax=Catellatospora methionotrophica TaxID=121620 RepID=A0A8J3PI29_9ACTN|nr:GNAT family N-acetyltransferase [Catellatospora methionotrophica]GIG15971.1 N-acetyltransferase [Catellatospora methionotrophica]
MPSMITIREAGPGDGDILGEIHANSWGVSHGPLCTPRIAAAGIEERRTKWHAILAEGGDPVLLGFLDDRPGAFIRSGASSRPGLAEIHSLFAHPDFWGTGLSAALLTDTLDRLRGAGYDRVHLWTLRDSAQARRFYAKHGFAETGRSHDHDFGEGTPIALLELDRAIGDPAA